MSAISGVTGTEAASPTCARPAQGGVAAASTAVRPGSGRALALLEASPAMMSIGTATQRPTAEFLAQLIATAQQAPQTRQRRRGEPAEVTSAYAAAAAPAPWIGAAVYRSL